VSGKEERVNGTVHEAIASGRRAAREILGQKNTSPVADHLENLGVCFRTLASHKWAFCEF